MNSLTKKLEKVYKLVGWIEDPFTQAGRKRYENFIKLFDNLIEHEWISQLLKKRKIKIADVCGGTGIGGVALAKVLSKYTSIELYVIDLRQSALNIAKRFSKQELSVEAITIFHDVRKLYELGKKWDIILMTGYSMSHFSPWDGLKIFANFGHSITDDGIVLLDECDRIFHIFLRAGYKYVLPEKLDEESVTISLHKEYDPIKGEIKRVYVDLINKLTEEISIYFWSLSELLALLWTFFGDIDFIPKQTRYYGFILARKPRRKLTPDDFEKVPRVLQGKQI